MPTIHPASLDINVHLETDPDGSHPEAAPLLHHTHGLARYIGDAVEQYLTDQATSTDSHGVYEVDLRYGGGRVTYRAADYPAEPADEEPGS